MSSLTPEDKATPTQPKSKQERIRDNQRRSRARRQEYLADLERRLSECQLTCRDADIHRAAFLELQIENTRLRELLALAGVNDQFVEHYVSQAVAQASQYPQDMNPALRQLKPKITPVESSRTLSSNARHASIGSQGQSGQSGQPNSTVRSAPNLTMPDRTFTPTPPTAYPASTPFHISSPLQQQNLDWLYHTGQSMPMPSPQLPQHFQQVPTETFTCDTFGLSAGGAPRVADEGSVLCSVAKQMIDQYALPAAEMEHVKSRLSQGFCRPAYPGAPCAVDNQVLFQVLNDLSTKYS